MTSEKSKAFLGLSERELLLLFVAGVFGEIILELISWGLVPLINQGRPMRPDVLITNLGQSVLGVGFPTPFSVAVHLILGAVIFPVVYALFRRATSIQSPVLGGLIIGVVLWLTAQSILAPLAGRPIFLGFIPYTWASLFAHSVFMITVAVSYDRLSRRFANLA